MRKNRHGIYCLEVGEWFGSLTKKDSVAPVLQLLHDSPLSVPFIHRDIATDVEFRYYLAKWTQSRHNDYPILYLSFHGSPGCIHVFKENGKPAELSTDDLLSMLEGKCNRRLIHFGCCSVLNMHGHIINKYLRESGAVAVSGYSQDVDWIKSTVFEMLYLSELQTRPFTKASMTSIHNRMRKIASPLCKELGFRMVVKK